MIVLNLYGPGKPYGGMSRHYGFSVLYKQKGVQHGEKNQPWHWQGLASGLSFYSVSGLGSSPWLH